MSPGRRPLGRTAIVVCALTALLTAGASGFPMSGSATAAAMDKAPVGGPAARAVKSAATEEAAQARAMESGDPVEVRSLRGERTETVANADGTFTTKEYVQPVRAWKDGQWKDIDTMLIRRADGSYAPRAAVAAMAFSGGGNRTFGTIERSGRTMSVGWRSALPEPRVEGSTATYPEVLPGVDLRVIAEAEGFSHLLVVKSAEAAANPALASIELPVRTDGLAVRATAEQGGLEAVDQGAGGAVFEAPAPMMWDSGHDAKARSTARRSASAEGLGAPEGSQIADVGLDVRGDSVVLTPDTGLLTGDDTVYPVYIDPVVKTANRTGWTMVSSHYSNSEFWKFSGDEGVGRCPANVSVRCSSNDDRKRQLFAIPTGSFEGKHIVEAEFAVTMVHTYDETGKSVELGRVNSSGASAISSGTNWGNQPSLKDAITSQSPTNPAGSCTSTNQNVRFNVKSTLQKAADSGWDTTTFRLKAADEDSYAYWKRFCGNAHLEVTYNRPPYQPLMSHLSMSDGGSCAYGSDRPYAAEIPTLNALIRDPDHGDAGGNTETVQARFKVYWPSSSPTHTYYATAQPKSTHDYDRKGNVGAAHFKFKVGEDLTGDGEPAFSIPQNTVIAWEVQGFDGTQWGPWSSAGDEATRCEFIYDSTAPKPPRITSATYPSDEKPHDGAGDYGSFILDSPSSDAVKYTYRFIGQGWKTAQPATPGGPVVVRFLPSDAGLYLLEVKAVDNAGNTGKTPFGYDFWVNKGRAPKAAWSLGDPEGSDHASGSGGAPAARAGSGVRFGQVGPSGDIDKAAALDGSGNAYLDVGAPALDTGKTFSVAAWVYLPEIPTRSMAVVSQDGTAEPGFVLGYDYDTKSWTFRTPVSEIESMGSWKVSGGIARARTWTHLIGVYDGDEGKLRLYVNGLLVKDDIQPRRTVWNARGGLQIGRALMMSGYTAHLKGTVADVKMYDRVVSEKEGGELGGTPTHQVAYWAMESSANGLSPDEDPKRVTESAGEPISLKGGATIYTPSNDCDPHTDPDCQVDPDGDALRGNGHLALDGSAGYATRAAGLLEPEGSFSVTARARLSAPAADRDQTVLALSGSKTQAAVVRYSHTANRWELAVTKEDAASSALSTTRDKAVLPSVTGQGDHLALVYDSVFGEVRLYVNGQLAGAQIMWRNTWDLSRTSLQVGRSLSGATGGDYFSGALDEVRLYQGALDYDTTAAVNLLEAGSSLAESGDPPAS
ncbi:LamG-like jellyroll fold domain-containing protein [Streptomyces milbemycinicus]|uniref:LamG-like jellyroll fold domain-containing protein n=1 Tax=Streptomyces milbemycinicus TaxID=476552 RepID=A0ABW8LTX9_9ACTN